MTIEAVGHTIASWDERGIIKYRRVDYTHSGALRYAYPSGTGWTTETVIEPNIIDQQVVLQIDSDDHPHIVHRSEFSEDRST